jgi:hypothetical protein
MTSLMADTDAKARQAKALELHLAGATYDAIATAVGYASRSGSYKAVQEALTSLGDAPGMAEAVDTELARLDAMLTGLWPKARRGDVQAVDRVLRIGERRTALLAMTRPAVKPEKKVTALDELANRRKSPGRPNASRQPRAARAAK